MQPSVKKKIKFLKIFKGYLKECMLLVATVFKIKQSMMNVVKKGFFTIIMIFVMNSVKSLQNVVMKADETLSGIFTKFDEELVVSRNHAHVVIDFDLSTINTQFYQIKIAIENSNFLW